MRLFLKVLVIAVVLALVFALGFVFWGERFERVLRADKCAEWFARSRPYAWAFGIGLLVGDLLLPIPATGVMAALGSVYGPVLGGLIAAVGSAGSGLLGYSLARLLGRRATPFLTSDEELARFRTLFEEWGGAGIIVSRMMPILPEVMAILAGLARMGFLRFLTALLLGTLPTSFLFAYVGHASRSAPWYGLMVAVLVPVAIWPIFLRFASHRRGNADPR